jgi:hypothetical protein
VLEHSGGVAMPHGEGRSLLAVVLLSPFRPARWVGYQLTLYLLLRVIIMDIIESTY